MKRYPWIILLILILGTWAIAVDTVSQKDAKEGEKAPLKEQAEKKQEPAPSSFFEIHPALSVDEKGATISIDSALNLARVRLFWTMEDVPAPVRYEMFPRYPYFAYNKTPAKTHQFLLPFELAKKEYYQTELPYNKIIRFRIDALAQTRDSFTFLHSKEYRFKVIKGKEQKPAFGLMFSDGPFIASTSESSVVLSWETNFPSKAQIIFFENGNKDKRIIDTTDKTRRSILTLSQLRPGSRYQYQIRCMDPELGDEIISPEYFFRTAPKPGKPFRFAVMCDSREDWRTPDPDSALNGVNVTVLNKLVTDAFHKDVDFIVFVGDLIAGNTTSLDTTYLQYQTWKEAVAGVNAFIPIYPVMGNHDSLAPKPKKNPGKGDLYPEDVWRSVFILPENGPKNQPSLPPYLENVYSFDYAGAHFAVLNTSYYSLSDPAPEVKNFAHRIDEIQRDWFQLNLEASRNSRFSFAFWHEPLYPTSSHYGSSVDRVPEIRDTLVSILDGFDVDVLFSGHEHCYSRLYVDRRIKKDMKGGFWQIVTGGVGAPGYPQNHKVPWANLVQNYSMDYHWVLAEVEGSQMNFTVYNDKGQVIDQFKAKARDKK